MKIRLVLALIVLVALAALPAAAAKRVLVVINQSSPVSVDIGNYYARKRQIPANCVCKLRCKTDELVGMAEYEKVRSAIRSHLTRNKLKEKIDYIVLTKGIPIRVDGQYGAFSMDSMLTVLWSGDILRRMDNPYFRSTRPFSYTDQGFYLVTRLDGYTAADAKRLVDLSLSAKRKSGIFLFDPDPGRDGSPGYSFLNDSQREAVKLLKAKKLTCKAVTTGYPGGTKGLMGYYTWGSNQGKFDHKLYAGNSFYPGAIAETVVSTSGRTFNHTTGGQSLIADLIKSGVTGVKGYVTEPYAIAIARADILFDRYTSGMNLADSFYSASPYIHWMDVVIGDPLCAPFASARAKK
jgi:uncharacterized protein (TIGR03790 family)